MISKIFIQKYIIYLSLIEISFYFRIIIFFWKSVLWLKMVLNRFSIFFHPYSFLQFDYYLNSNCCSLFYCFSFRYNHYYYSTAQVLTVLYEYFIFKFIKSNFEFSFFLYFSMNLFISKSLGQKYDWMDAIINFMFDLFNVFYAYLISTPFFLF